MLANVMLWRPSTSSLNPDAWRQNVINNKSQNVIFSKFIALKSQIGIGKLSLLTF